MKRFFNSLFGKDKKEPTLYFNTIDISEAIANANGTDKMLKIVPIGSFPNHHQGPFVITEKEITEMVTNGKNAGTDILIDYGHESNWDMGAKAAGWSSRQSLEAREDGLYIEFPTFTEAAQEKINKKEYRYLSPVFQLSTVDKKGAEGGAMLLSIGIVNRPYFDKEIDHIGNAIQRNIKNGKKIINQEGQMLPQFILDFFGLAEGATIEDLQTLLDTEELKGKTFREILDVYLEAKKKEEGTTPPTDVEAEVDKLKEEIDELKKVNATRYNEKADALVNQAIADGKILPADKDVWLNSALKNYDDTKAKLDAKKSTMPKGMNFTGANDDDDMRAVANAARTLVEKEAKLGHRISYTEAVNRVKRGES